MKGVVKVNVDVKSEVNELRYDSLKSSNLTVYFTPYSKHFLTYDIFWLAAMAAVLNFTNVRVN